MLVRSHKSVPRSNVPLDVAKTLNTNHSLITCVHFQIDDFKQLDKVTQTAKSVAIVGGGFLGSELACALGKRGKYTGDQKEVVFSVATTLVIDINEGHCLKGSPQIYLLFSQSNVTIYNCYILKLPILCEIVSSALIR